MNTYIASIAFFPSATAEGRFCKISLDVHEVAVTAVPATVTGTSCTSMDILQNSTLNPSNHEWRICKYRWQVLYSGSTR